MGRSCSTLVANPDCHSALLADAGLSSGALSPVNQFSEGFCPIFLAKRNGSEWLTAIRFILQPGPGSGCIVFLFFLALGATVYGARWSHAFRWSALLPNAARRCSLASPRFMPLKFCPTRLGVFLCSRGSTGQVGSPISGFVWQVLMVLSVL